MAAIGADYDHLPIEMRSAKRWLLWQSVRNLDPTKKPRKVPYYASGIARNGELDSAADQGQLASFDVALQAIQAGGYTGLGFALGPDGTDNHWQGIDLDKLSIHPELHGIAQELPGYTELSPSGNGKHAIGYGRSFQSLGSDASGIEAYSRGRFFTVTANASSGSANVCLADFVEQRLRPMHGRKSDAIVPTGSSTQDAVISPQTYADMRSALLSMPSDDRDVWVRMGHALKTLDNVGYVLWLEWSKTSEKFEPGDAARTWESFKPTRTGYQAVFTEAQDCGWANPRRGLAPAPDSGIFGSGVSTLPSMPVGAPSVDPSLTASIEVPFPPPFRGVMYSVVEAALAVSTKPQRDLCTLSALIGMAASCSGNHRLPSGMRLNLFGCGIAGTGEGKDLPRSIATSLVTAAKGKLIGKPASGQGLEDVLVSATGSLIALDEIAHFFAAINNSKAPPHLIELAGTLLQLFSASKGTYQTRSRASARGTTPSQVIQNPVVSLLGFATPEKLGEAMGVSNIEDGLLGRFVFAFGQTGIVPRRVKGSFELPDVVKMAADAIHQATKHAAFVADLNGNRESILIGERVESRLRELLVEFDQQRLASQSPFAKALLTRSCEKCERIAGVLAVWDCPTRPEMTLEHLEWAEQFLHASDAALLRFSGEYMHGGQTQSDAQRILKLLRRVLAGDFKPQKPHEKALLDMKVAPYSMVMRASKLDKRRFDEALAYLVDLSDVESGSAPSAHPNGRAETVRWLSVRT